MWPTTRAKCLPDQQQQQQQQQPQQQQQLPQICVRQRGNTDCASQSKTNLTYIECKLSRIIVHAAAMHKRQDIPYGIGFQHFFLGNRTDSSVGQSSRDHRHRFTVRLQRTALKH